MARRAPRAVAVALALAMVAVPAALIATAAPAAAAATQGSQASATVTITGLSPQWAGPGTTVTVTGIVTNRSAIQRHLVVQLLDSTTQVSSVSELEHAAASFYAQANVPVPTATWESGLLSQGASASWSLRLPTSAMTSFGVYPVAAQVEDVFDQPLNWTESFLPYVPDKKGAFGSTVPTAQKVAWVWPLIDEPLLGEPWQHTCSGSQAAALAKSLGSGGRLGQLLNAAAAPAGSAVTSAVQEQAVKSDSSHPAKPAVARGQQPQSLASADGLTWAIDPALLTNVSALAGCGASEPQWARSASAWLAKLRAAVAGQPAFATAYGDPDMAALIGASTSLAADVQRSFTYGRSQAHQILGPELSPSPAGTAPTAQDQAAGVAWAADTQVNYGTLEALAAPPDDIGTVLLSSSAFPAEQSSVLRTPNGSGGYLNVLLASDSLTSVLSSATSAPGSGFAAAQDFLAETALMAQQDPSTPIIVAPPQRWQLPAGLAADLLRTTASAPWLSPTSLTSLTEAKNIPTVQQWPTSVNQPTVSQTELGALNTLDRDVKQLQQLRARRDPDLYLAVSTVESSAYEGRFKAGALAMIATLTTTIGPQQRDVHIVAANRITLGGLRGSVPVSVDNSLGFAVRVGLQLNYDAIDGAKVAAAAPGVITVPAHTAETVKLRFSASQTGSTTISMALADGDGQRLAIQPVRMTVQTTQVGLLGIVIFAAALGVFLLASATRAIRRGHPQPAADASDSPPPSEHEQSGHITEEASPDTVESKHSELGTAGTPRPR
jgi:Family of unknown function (DUF6049)